MRRACSSRLLFAVLCVSYAGAGRAGAAPDAVPPPSSDVGAFFEQQNVSTLFSTPLLAIIDRDSCAERCAAGATEQPRCSVWLFTVVSTDFDETLVWFVSHYLRRGVPLECILLVLHSNSVASSRMKMYESLATALGICHLYLWYGEYTSHRMLLPMLYLLKRFVQPSDWVVHADSDEFIALPPNITEYTASIPDSVSCIRSRLVDRLAPEGPVSPVFGVDLESQFPLRCKITSLLQKTLVYKVVLYRGGMRSNAGNHAVLTMTQLEQLFAQQQHLSRHFTKAAIAGLFMPEALTNERTTCTDFSKLANDSLAAAELGSIAHFKWTGTLRDKIKARIQTYASAKELSHGGWRFYQPLQDALDKGDALIKYCQ